MKGSGGSQIDLDVGSPISMAITEQNSLTIFFAQVLRRAAVCNPEVPNSTVRFVVYAI